LEITRINDIFRYSIYSLGKPFGPAHKVFKSEICGNILNTLLSQINHHLTTAYSKSQFISTCNLLYNHLIPKKLDVELSKESKYLTIISEEQVIPWELLHDGTTFFGIKLHIGRCLLNKNTVQMKQISSVKKNKSCLIIANPTEDLVEAEKETVSLMRYLRLNNVVCNYLARSEASLQNVLLELNSNSYDFIHYCGHIVKNSSGDNSLRLYNNELLDSQTINRLKLGTPLVFLNACSATKTEEDENSTAITNASAIPFLYSGASAVIGTFFAVTDISARRFSETFYRLVFEGEPIGKAISKAKSTLFKDENSDPTWASFLLYGNPGLTLLEEETISHKAYLGYNMEGIAQRVEIDRDCFVIGRNREKVDLLLADITVGRTHAEILFKSKKYFLKDLNSKNGTFVNEKPVTNGEVELTNNDIIKISTIEIKFSW
jgi:hypothetical protein